MPKEPKPTEPDASLWKGEVGELTQKVRRDRGVTDPEVPDDEDDPTLPPALRP